jgi:dTDP-L-rhamnose 4-epimerase
VKLALNAGGAGFIRSHLADALLQRGTEVQIPDILNPQVHRYSGARPEYLRSDVELIRGDIRSPELVRS